MFCAVVWALGTLFHGGALGKWCDDYGNYLRDPVSDTFSFAAYTPRLTGRAPLTYAFHAYAQNVFWHADWVVHAFAAAMHGVNAVLVGLLVRSVLGGWRGAVLAGLVAASWPAGHEAVFWMTGICAVLGPTAALGLMLLYTRFAQGRVGWWFLVPGVVLAWMIPAFYEQPALVLPVLPLLYLAAARTGEPGIRRVVRGTLAGVVLCVGLVVYLWGMVSTLSPESRGGASSFTTLEQLPAKIAATAGQAWSWMTMQELGRGMVRQGFLEFAAHPASALVWTAALMLAGAGFWRAWTRGPLDQPPAGDEPGVVARRRWFLGLFALAWAVAMFVPVAAVRDQGVVSRLVYAPGLAAALLVGVVADWLAPRAGRERGWVVRAIGAGAIVFAVFGAVALVGAQGGFKRRSEMDIAQWAQLRAAVPDAKPGTLFVPLDLRDWATSTGSRRFDSQFLGVFDFSYTMGRAARAFLGRRDVANLGHNRWRPGGAGDFTDADERGLVPLWDVGLPGEAKGTRVPWERVVPFVVDARGVVTLVTEVVVDGPGGVSPPIPTQGAQPGAARKRFRVVQTLAESTRYRGVTGFGRERGPGLMDVTAWRRTARALAMHPPIGSNDEQSRAELAIGASESPRRLVFRATFGPARVRAPERGDGVELVARLEGEQAKELARVAMDPADIGANPRWITFAVDVPAGGAGRRLVIEALGGKSGDVNYDGFYLAEPVERVE